MEKSLPRIAVLLAAYNGAAYISEQLNSILRQLDVSVTIYISVDSSSDGTEQLVDCFAAKDERIRVLPHGCVFGGAARNFFRLIRDVDTSQFDYVSFADQDDIWYTSKLAVAVEALINNFSDAYSSNVTAFWEDGAEKLIVKSQKQVKYDFLFEAAGPGCTYVFTCKYMENFKRDVIFHWDELQDVALHDWYCYAYARANKFKWIIDHQSTMRYRQHSLNQVGVNFGLKAYKYRLMKVVSGWWLEQSLLIASLIGLENIKFVRQWSSLNRYGIFKLACNATVCRRKFSDKISFFLLCIFISLSAPKKR